MSRFFFDITVGGVEIQDREGSELARPADVSELAMGVLAEMLHPGRERAKAGEFFVLARDEAGRTIYRATLTLAGEWVLPDPGLAWPGLEPGPT